MEHFLGFLFLFFYAFSFLERALTFLLVITLVLSYYHACEANSMEFDKLLRTLIVSDLKG